jgi:hypothetical protein
MRKKELIWIGILLVLGGVYLHYFTGSAKKTITVRASIRPTPNPNATVFPVFFNLDGSYALTSVKVYPYDSNQPNAHVTPVWHLISKSNSAPTKVFSYGRQIKGMEPALKGVHPEPLSPDVVYRLEIAAGSVTGYADFKTQAMTPGN